MPRIDDIRGALLAICGSSFAISAERGLQNNAIEYYGVFNRVHLIVLRVKNVPNVENIGRLARVRFFG